MEPPNDNLTPIPENDTPDSQGSTVSEDVQPSPEIQPILADINDQSTSGEPVSTDSTVEYKSQEESNDITPDPVEEMSADVGEPAAENPPFLQPIAKVESKSKLPEDLRKAANLRKTLKHRKRIYYDKLSDEKKADEKKTIIDNLIHVLRESSHKSVYNSHKKSIVKLRHTLNKHLDYIETKKRVKKITKNKKSKIENKKTVKTRSNL